MDVLLGLFSLGSDDNIAPELNPDRSRNLRVYLVHPLSWQETDLHSSTSPAVSLRVNQEAMDPDDFMLEWR